MCIRCGVTAQSSKGGKLQAIDKTLVGTNWVDLYTLFGIPLTESFRLQNKSSDWVTIQAVASQPSAGSADGTVLEPFGSIVITPDGGGAWARVTNDYIATAIVTYHPITGIQDEVYTGEGGGSSTVDGSVSVKGVRNTLAQELLVGHRNDDINVQFQYNVSYNQDQSDTVGSTSGTATITHSNSMAVLQSTSTGSAFLRSADSIRYFPGHEFSAEMTAIASSGVSGSSVWGVGDNGATGDCVAFTVQNGVFGIRFKSNGVVQFIPQSSFNGDKADGTGPSGKTIIPSNLNLYTIRGGWYGILPISFGWYSGSDTGYITLHTIDHTNQQQQPNISNPTLPIFAEVSGTASLSTASWRGGICGATPEDTKANRLFNISVSDKNIVANALTPVVTLRNNSTFQGKVNHVRARYGTVTLAADGQKTFNWAVFKNPTLVGASFVQKNPQTSVVSYDVSATAISPPTPDNIGGTVMGKYDNARINLFQGDVTLAVYPGETITLAVQSAGNGVVSAFVRWIEEF
jgi:hypothetical protein